MKQIVCVLIGLIATTFIVNAQSPQIGIKSKFKEGVQDSVEVITTQWLTDNIEYGGDPQCAHIWVNGEMFWHNDREIAGRDSLKLSKLPPRHVLPRICSKCLRKEYMIEGIVKQKVGTEYSKLQRQLEKN